MSPIKSLYKFLSPRYQSLFLEYKVDLKPRYGYGKPANQFLLKIINENRIEYETLLKSFVEFEEVFQKIKTNKDETAGTEPYWNNGYLPGLDIVALYSLFHRFKPLVYVEIGSGNSTIVARKAISDHNLKTKIVSIDPYPREEIDKIADEVIRKPLEDLTDFSFIEKLEENDFLFIDNSHRALPNSDVTVCFLELIPRLKRGVIVQVHDVYLPYDYPQFMCDRFYSEQYLLATLLLADPEKYKTILPNYFISEDDELKKNVAPIFHHPSLKNVERHGGSYWLQVAQ